MPLQFKKRKIGSSFDTINEMSEYATLIQLMDRIGNVIHAETSAGVWIFDNN